jgi:transposase InsO family protein
MDYAQEFTVERMCRVFKVSKSGFYKWKKNRPETKRKESELDDLILYEYERSKCTYGSPRLAQALNEVHYVCSQSTVARRMNRLGIKARSKRKHRVTTDSNHKYGVFANILDRQFEQDIPGDFWVSDITYIRVSGYWLYLTVVIDLADRMVVGWSLSKDMSARNTVIKAFNNACAFRKPNKGFLFHSDRGVQYACNDFTQLIKMNHGKQSMSRKGNCWDNAVAESFFKTIKIEWIYQLRLVNKQEAEIAIFDYIDGWYNTLRIHTALDGLSPLKAFIKKSNYLRAA